MDSNIRRFSSLTIIILWKQETIIYITQHLYNFKLFILGMKSYRSCSIHLLPRISLLGYVGCKKSQNRRSRCCRSWEVCGVYKDKNSSSYPSVQTVSTLASWVLGWYWPGGYYLTYNNRTLGTSGLISLFKR